MGVENNLWKEAREIAIMPFREEFGIQLENIGDGSQGVFFVAKFGFECGSETQF